jgi:hypothetical protein
MTDKDKKLAILIQENPDLELIIYVDNDEILLDFAYSAHRIGRAEKSFYAVIDENCFDDKDECFKHLTEYLEMPEDEARAWIKKNGKEIILVRTFPG